MLRLRLVVIALLAGVFVPSESYALLYVEDFENDSGPGGAFADSFFMHNVNIPGTGQIVDPSGFAPPLPSPDFALFLYAGDNAIDLVSRCLVRRIRRPSGHPVRWNAGLFHCNFR
jgi:hypothetical protein